MNETVFGISCNRQINSHELLNKGKEVTRSTVQKAIVILASKVSLSQSCPFSSPPHSLHFFAFLANLLSPCLCVYSQSLDLYETSWESLHEPSSPRGISKINRSWSICFNRFNNSHNKETLLLLLRRRGQRRKVWRIGREKVRRGRRGGVF